MQNLISLNGLYTDYAAGLLNKKDFEGPSSKQFGKTFTALV